MRFLNANAVSVSKGLPFVVGLSFVVWGDKQSQNIGWASPKHRTDSVCAIKMGFGGFLRGFFGRLGVGFLGSGFGKLRFGSMSFGGVGFGVGRLGHCWLLVGTIKINDDLLYHIVRQL